MKLHATYPVVFIAASGHSGSTLLELLLARNEKCVGIGEAFQLVDSKNSLINHLDNKCCSCGKLIEQCGLWGSIVSGLRKLGDDPLARYELVLRTFRDAYSDHIIVDSSKTVRAMQTLSMVPGIDLRILHLMRDVRAWCTSMHEAYRRDPSMKISNLIRDRGLRGFWRFLRMNRFLSFQEWYLTQKHIEESAQRVQHPMLRVNYERLAIYPEQSLRDICDFLSLEFDKKMLVPYGANAHNIFGNRMRFDPNKLSRISYHYSWLYARSWQLPALLMPHVMRYNRNASADFCETE